jgi:hypothetical protein
MRLQIPAMILCGALAASAWPAPAEISVKDYCEATLKASEVAELEWKDRISVAQSHQGTAKALDIKLRALDVAYGGLRNQLYAHYGTTFQDYLRFGASHQSAIKLYLEQNVGVSGTMNDVSARIQSLRRQMESLMAARQVPETRK